MLELILYTNLWKGIITFADTVMTVTRGSLQRPMVLYMTMVNLVITLFASHPPCSSQFLCTFWQLSNGGRSNEEVTKTPELLDKTPAQDTCVKPTQAIAMLFLNAAFCFLKNPVQNLFFLLKIVISTAKCNRLSFPYLRLHKAQAKTKTQAKNNLKTALCAHQFLFYSSHPGLYM